MVQPTYLGMTHSGFAAGDPSAAQLSPAEPVARTPASTASRLDDRRGLVAQLDRYRRAPRSARRASKPPTSFGDQAFQLLTSTAVADAFAIDKEKPDTRDRYGRHLWGQSCLLARRLAEAGASVITIDALSPVPSNPIYFSWDDHSNPATGWNLEGAMRWRAPFMDQGLSALIEDIYARGLDRKIMVVAVGEFGRTPRLASPQGVLGRDHWPAANRP